MTLTDLKIESCLNNTLNWLDNHEKEYWKLFKEWQKEIKKLLEFQKKEILEKLIENFEKRDLSEIWNESFELKNCNFEEKQIYIDWYNWAVKEINKRMKSFWEYYKKTLEKII